MKTQPDPCLMAASEISHMATLQLCSGHLGPSRPGMGGSETAARAFSAVTTAEMGTQELVQNQQVCSEISFVEWKILPAVTTWMKGNCWGMGLSRPLLSSHPSCSAANLISLQQTPYSHIPCLNPFCCSHRARK